MLNLLLDPCNSAFSIHLRIRDNGTAEGLTADGARLIEILRLDDEKMDEWRGRMLQAIRRIERALRPKWWRLAWSWVLRRFGLIVPSSEVPPEVMAELVAWFGFPDDLPDLNRFRLRGGNTRPGGVAEQYFALRQQAMLPAVY
jgi:hypothetical protein